MPKYEFYRLTQGKVLRIIWWTIKAIGIWLIVTLTTAVLVVIVAYWSLISQSRGNESQLVEADLPLKVIDRIQSHTMELVGSDGHLYGSAFVSSDQNMLITNYHVASTLCRNRNCNFIRIKSDPTQTASTWGLSVHSCSRWLDYCLLVRDSDAVDLNLLFSSVASPSKKKNVYVAPHDESARDSTKTLRQGVVKKLTPTTGILALYARGGYSGSGVFDTNGQLIGLVSRAATDSIVMVQPKAILELLGLPILNLYQPLTTFVRIDAIKRHLCSEKTEDCLKSHLSLFLTDLEHRLSNQSPSLISTHEMHESIRDFWLDLQTDFSSTPASMTAEMKLVFERASMRNFELNFVAMREELQDPFWYKVFLTRLAFDTNSSSTYKKDLMYLAGILREWPNPPDKTFSDNLASWLEDQ